MIKSIYLFSIFVFSFFIANSQTIDMEEMDKLIESKINEFAPGLAVGIVKNGEVIYEKYVGYANLADSIKINPRSKFNIASNAKQFTAFCVLKLVEEGDLSLEDDFRKYLPEYFSGIEAPIKIKHLITHTSGIRDFYDLMSLQGEPWWQRVGLDNKDALRLLQKQLELNFNPGSDYSYSNSNYTLLTAIVEKVSGQSFETYAAKVFTSFEMTQTSFLTNYMAVLPNKTLAYSDWGDGKWQQYPMVISLYGDGFLFTTLRDQLRWEQIVQNRNTMGDGLIVASQMNVSGSDTSNYGYGVEFDIYKGFDRIFHAGSTGAYGAQFLRFPSENLSIVVMTNNGNVWAGGLANELADLLLDISDVNSSEGKEMPTVLEEKPNEIDLQGDYRLEEGTIIKIKYENGKLSRFIYGRDPVQLIYQEGNVYYYETFKELKMAFTKNASGTYDFTLYQPGINPRLAPRIKEEIIEDSYYKSIEGSYRNEEIDVAFDIHYLQNGTYEISQRGNKVDEAGLVIKDELVTNNFRMKVVYDVFNRVSALLVDNNRNRNSRFNRIEPGSFNTILSTTSGGTISVSTISNLQGKRNGGILLTKNDQSGNEEWAKIFGGKGYDIASELIATKDGGYLIVGSTSSYGNGNYDMYLIKVNVKGKELWSRTYGDFYNEYGFTAKETDTGYLLKGTKQECSSNSDVVNRTCATSNWKVKIDFSGNEISEGELLKNE